MTTVDLEQPVGGAPSPAPPTGDAMACLRCSRRIHRQHEHRCPDCHQARGLCHNCYWRSRTDGTIDGYPPLVRGHAIRRDCVHGGIHQHGTVAMYLRDRCRCIPCRDAKTNDLAQWRIRRYVHGPDTVNPIGTQRRLQALAAIGWSLTEIARRLDTDPTVLRPICRGDRKRVHRRTADRIRGIYDELSMTPRIGTDLASRIAVTKTLTLARSNGWAPPLAWDEDTIDDPAAAPYTAPDSGEEFVDEMAVQRFIDGDRTIRLNHPERVEAARRLIRAGRTHNDVMHLLRVNGQTWRRVRTEALTDMEAAA